MSNYSRREFMKIGSVVSPVQLCVQLAMEGMITG